MDQGPVGDAEVCYVVYRSHVLIHMSVSLREYGLGIDRFVATRIRSRNRTVAQSSCEGRITHGVETTKGGREGAST